MPKIWDISPPVDPSSPVFEGDTRYSQHWTWRMGPNCPVNVSAVTLSPHVGAHADAPLHYHSQGAAVGALDLEPYLGPCRVIHALKAGACVEIDELAHAGADLPPRVLLRTRESFAHASFDPHFKAIAPQALSWLADRGVRLVGIDSASVDPATSKDLPAHQVLLQRNVRVLENLCLDEVAEGDYELIALPLKWMHCDASPVRAVLRELP
jgi:arylformamidase